MATGSVLSSSCINPKSVDPMIQINKLDLKIFATNWGFNGTMQQFCKKSKDEGYDGVEIWVPNDQKDRDDFFDAIAKNNLEFGFLAGNSGKTFQENFDAFQMQTERAAGLKPVFVNCHSGTDFYTPAQNDKFIEHTLKLEKSTEVPIYHETHRARILFAAHVTKEYLNRHPQLRLTLDISHWCCVAASLLANQTEAVDMALKRTDHIHSRVGFDNGPQIPEPRAPEFASAVDAHFAWWDKVVEYKSEEGKPLTMTTEFGPPGYMWTLPYTKQPVANLWDVNVHMMRMWRERYQS